jgi:hypothetical protein
MRIPKRILKRIQMLAPLVATTLLASCGCNLVGCLTGLSVEVTNAPAGPITVEAHASGAANNAVYTASCPSSTGCVNTVYFPDFTPTRVQLKITTTAGTRTTEAFPKYTRQQPNGENCSPTCYVSDVQFTWQ